MPGEEHIITSTEFLEPDELPERIVLVGGGYNRNMRDAHIVAASQRPQAVTGRLAFGRGGLVVRRFLLVKRA
jgi:hypothetical protein